MESATQAAASTGTLESRSPTTGEVIGSVPTITAAEVQGVVDEVARIQPAWAQLTTKDRARYMLRAADALLDEIDEIAELLVREQGKPRVEAYTMELLPTVDALHWVAKAGPKILADDKPALVVLELGANDGLRGLPIAEIRENLTTMIRACQASGAAVVLLGIELPINYGPQYREGLRGMYRDLAAEFNLPLVPFLLDGVALDPALMQDDGLHPKSEGEPKVLDNVWPVLEPALARLK